MRRLVMLASLAFSVPVQIHLFSLFPFPFPLNLALIITYYTGYFYGKDRGMAMGVFLGLLLDILSGGLLGSQMFLLTLIGYLAAACGLAIYSKDVPVHFLLLAAFSMIHGLGNLFLIHLFEGSLQPLTALSRIILPAVFLNALIGSLLIYWMRRRSTLEK